MRPGPILHGAALAASLGGCATVERPDLSTERCADDFARQLGDVIYSRRESRAIANDFADDATDLEQRSPFLVLPWLSSSRGSSLRSFFLAAERDDVRRRNEGGG